MKQLKEGFYIGFRKLSEDGSMMHVENTYGTLRTSIIIASYIVGFTVIGMSIIGASKGCINYVKDKINDNKKNKEIESK